jgi:hypothetical protein
MMPVIRLSDATFSELKTISTWLSANTPSETIDKLVREKLDELGLESEMADEPDAGSTHDILKFDKAPGLSFTRLTAATVGGVPIQKNNWANLLSTMIGALKSKGLSGEKLVADLQVPARVGEYSDDGYRYYPELGISVQGQAAQDAWKEIERISNKWAIPVEAEFQWRQNAKALHPGRSGIIRAKKKGTY